MFWWVDSLLPSGPCGPSCSRPAAQGSREASKNAAVPTFWPQPVPGHMELSKQKCLAAIAVMSQNMFAAWPFPALKLWKGYVFPSYFHMPYVYVGKHFCTCTILCTVCTDMLPNIHIHIIYIILFIYYIIYILYIYTVYCSERVADLIPHEDKLCIRVGDNMLIFFSGKGWTLSHDRNFLIETRRWWAHTKSISGVCVEVHQTTHAPW